MKEEIEVEESSGNIFIDLGHPSPYEALAKSRLAQAIAALVDEQALTQHKIAELLDVDLSTISKLTRGQLRNFSIDELFRFLHILNQDFEIVIRKKPFIKQRQS